MSVKSIMTTAVAAAIFVGCGQPKPELRIYTWTDYISPAVIQKFEKRFNCTVTVDTFDTNEEMYAKIKSGGAVYDIAMPSSYQIDFMVKDGMIDELDHAKLLNVRKNFDKRFAAQIIDPMFTYNVPYAVTCTGFCYLKDKIPAGGDVNTWAILGNAAIKGRVAMLDDMREVIGAGLMYLGYSVNSSNPSEIDKAVEQVLKWKANIHEFDSENYKADVAKGKIVLGQGYSTDAHQLIVGGRGSGAKSRPDIGFVLPKEGFTIAFDEMVVLSASKRKDLAYSFMNFIYEPDIAKENMEYICGPNPVAPAIDALDENYRKMIVLDESVLKRGQLLLGLTSPEVVELYDKAWKRIKGAK